MKNFEEIIKKAKGVRMRPDEKSAIRARLYAVVYGREAGSRKQEARSWVSVFFRPIPMLASLMIALLVGGGVSFASENSLPGDLLYPIKVSINEEIRSKLALSVEAKADWEVTRVDRRLTEAEKLSDKGRLTSEQQEKVQIAFDKHAIAAQSRATAKVNEKIEKIARKHEKMIARITKQPEARVTTGASLVAEVKTKEIPARTEIEIEESADASHDDRRSAQETTLELTANRAMGVAENKISEVKKYIESVKDPEIKFKAEEYLDLAMRALIEGRARVEQKLYGEGIILFRKSFQIAQKAREAVDETLTGWRGEENVEIGGSIDVDVEIRGRTPLLP